MSDDDAYLLVEDNYMNENRAKKSVSNCEIVDLAIDDLKLDLNLDSEEVAVKSIENWSFKFLCPLSKIKLNNDAYEHSELVNESVEMFDVQDNVNSILGSTGMEYLIEEEQEANKKVKKNVKFNKAFDVAKVAAEYISMYNLRKILRHSNSLLNF